MIVIEGKKERVCRAGNIPGLLLSLKADPYNNIDSYSVAGETAVRVRLSDTPVGNHLADQCRASLGYRPMFSRILGGPINQDGWYNWYAVVSGNGETSLWFDVENALEEEDNLASYRIDTTGWENVLAKRIALLVKEEFGVSIEEVLREEKFAS